MRVLLIPDVVGWCWWGQAVAIKKYAPKNFTVVVLPQGSAKVFRCWDAVLSFSWTEGATDVHPRVCTVLAHHGCQYEFASDADTETDYRRIAATKIRNSETAKAKLPKFAAALCVNRALADYAYKLGCKSAFTPAGVDCEVFSPSRNPKRRRGGPLIVGWCGQCEAGIPNVKGYDYVLSPLMKRLEGQGIEFRLNTRTVHRAMPTDQMVDWYRSLDVFLCTSVSEGTPMPVLEAMACGIPVVSTSVGDVPDVVTPMSGILVGPYHNQETAAMTVESLSWALKDLADEPDTVEEMGRVARKRVLETRNWTELSAKWLDAIEKL